MHKVTRILRALSHKRTVVVAICLAVAGASITPSTASNPAPGIVEDINAGSGSSSPSDFTLFNSKVYFRAYSPATGHELYSYDGTSTQLIEVDPGSGSGYPQGLTVFNNKLYFMGETAATGQELFVYDGTSVSLAADINIGTGHSSPSELTVFNNQLYFRANAAATGAELYSFDGSSVSLVSDLKSGTGSGAPEELTVFNNQLFFSAWSTSNGNELFVFDGVSTTLIDINPGSGHGLPSNLTPFNGDLYFRGYQDSYNSEIFKYDGSSVSLVADINPGSVSSSASGLTIFNGKLYFNAYTPTNGAELYVHDGSSTTLIDIYPGSGEGNPYGLTVLNGNLYFRAITATAGAELFVYDGVSVNLAADILSGASGSWPSELTVFNDKLYFTASDSSWNTDLWIYDGSTATQYSVNSTGGSIDFMSGAGLRSTSLGLFFSADNGTQGFEPWHVQSVTPGAIATSSVIYNDDVGATIVVTSSGFKANGVLSLSEFTIDTAGTGLTASSVSVNSGATEATIAFTGTALTGAVSITANDAAFAVSPGSSSNTLSIPIALRSLPSCPVLAAITYPCLDSGSISRPTGSVGFRLFYSNNSGFQGASFSLLAEIETSTGVFASPEDGDVASALVLLYPTSSAIGARLATATWAMAAHKDFSYSKTIETVNGTEVVKLTTSYKYIDFVNKAGCGFGSMSFGDAPQAACESVGTAGDYDASANRSIDFFAATDMSWLVAATGADGGYLNALGTGFMWGSTTDTPLRFQLIGPHHKSANSNDLNSGAFQVYMPAALVTYVYGAGFNPNTNLSLTRQDEGLVTATLSGTAAVNLSQPLGGDLLIDVPTHPFSAPVFTVASIPTPSTAAYVGPSISAALVPALAGTDLVLSGSKLGTISAVSLAGAAVNFSSVSDSQLRISIPAALTNGTYDLVVESSYGKLVVQSAILVQSAIAIDSEPSNSSEAKPWTKKLDEATAKIYTKDLVGVGKVQFMLNGKEVAWVNAVSAEDPKLRTAAGASYLVRTVNLVQGQKNIIEIWINGVRESRTAYSY